jgi:hypothetical protein
VSFTDPVKSTKTPCDCTAPPYRGSPAALEALKIGRGGITYVAKVLGMSRRTIYTGIRELEATGDDDGWPPRRTSGHAPLAGFAVPAGQRQHPVRAENRTCRGEAEGPRWGVTGPARRDRLEQL